MNFNEHLEKYIKNILNESLIIESKQDQQRFIDKFGQETFDTYQKIKDRIPNEEFVSTITGEVIDNPKDIVQLCKVDKEVVQELINYYLGNRDVENKPIPKPANTKKLVYNENGYKIYYVTDYTDMIDISSEKYGGCLGRWCIAGRYAGAEITEQEVEGGKVKVSQAKQYFKDYLKDTDGGYYVVITPNNEKYCILTEDFQVWDEHDEQIDEEEFFYKNKEVEKFFAKLGYFAILPDEETEIPIKELNIEDITLLSVEEAKQLPKLVRKFYNWWWLRSPGNYQNYAAYVLIDGSVYPYGFYVDEEFGYVRPNLKISNLQSFNPPLYSKVILDNGTKWRVISDNMLLCDDKSFMTHRFNDYVKGKICNDYDKSEIKQYIYEKAKELGLL